VPFFYKALCFRPISQQLLNVHVILYSTFVILFEFQNRIFLEYFVRVSSCSNIYYMTFGVGWGPQICDWPRLHSPPPGPYSDHCKSQLQRTTQLLS
jgi:hypothetical protein